MRHFEQVAGMPGVWMEVSSAYVVQGTQKQSSIETEKFFFALNIMSVCDPNMVITNLVVNWPGSAHNSRIFRVWSVCCYRKGIQRNFAGRQGVWLHQLH